MPEKTKEAPALLRVIHYPGEPQDLGVVGLDGHQRVIFWMDGHCDSLLQHETGPYAVASHPQHPLNRINASHADRRSYETWEAARVKWLPLVSRAASDLREVYRMYQEASDALEAEQQARQCEADARAAVAAWRAGEVPEPAAETPPPRYSVPEWCSEAVVRFGPDTSNWRFVCPCCKHVASVAEWRAAGAPEGAIAFSCIGRWLEGSRDAFYEGAEVKPGPCNYAGGGLFGLNPVQLTDKDGIQRQVFDFAPAPEASTTPAPEEG